MKLPAVRAIPLIQPERYEHDLTRLVGLALRVAIREGIVTGVQVTTDTVDNSPFVREVEMPEAIVEEISDDEKVYFPED
jgi:hypothetical protein